MALSREDKHDVKSAMGKAIANKVSKVTKDGVQKKYKGMTGEEVYNSSLRGKSGISYEEYKANARKKDPRLFRKHG